MAGQLRVDEITDEAGTGAPEFPNGVDVGASGITFSDGTTQTTSGGNYIRRIITSSGTWEKPVGLKAIQVTVGGAGGGGIGIRSSSTNNVTSAFGGAGGVANEYIPAASIPGPVTVTIGAGGAAGVIGPGPTGPGPSPVNTIFANGSTGGATSFGAFVSATGGGGSTNELISGYRVFTTVGGIGSGGDFNYQSTATSSQLFDLIYNPNSTPNTVPGPTVPGFAGFLVTAGGTGGRLAAPSPTPASTGVPGGAGAGGVVIVEEFY